MKQGSMSHLKKIVRSDKFISYSLIFDVFIAGAAVMALEIAGSRILAPYFGSTVFVWGSLIGVVLSALSLGYYLGGKLADRKANFHIFSLIILVAGIFTLLTPFFSPYVLDFIVNLNINSTYGPLLATIALLGIPTTLLGMISPYAIKLRTKTIANLGNVAGNLYAISTLGSIVGTFLTVFVLIPRFGVTQIILAFSMTLILISLIGLKNKVFISICVVVLILILPTYAVIMNNVFDGLIDEVKFKKIYETDTLYYHLVVADDRDQDHDNHERQLFLDDLHQSSMYIDDPAETSFKYPYYFHLPFIFKPDIKKVLFIGGGALSAPKKFLKEYSDIEIDVVEIDPEVIEVAQRFFSVPDDDRLNIIIDDGRMFLTKSNKTYDLIVLDAYSGTYVPFHLMTLEFFELIKEDLSPDGVVVSNLITSLKGEFSDILGAEYKTMSRLFPNVYIFPTSTGNPILPQNMIFIATKSKEYYSKDALIKKAKNSTKIKIPRHNTFVLNYLEEDVDTTNSPLLTDDYAPVNNMLNPMLGVPLVKD